jgi:hypothetical protein
MALLKERHPEQLAEFQAWARERKFRKLSEVQGPALKGLVKKLQKIRDGLDLEPPEAEQAELLLDSDEAETPVEAPREEETL